MSGARRRLGAGAVEALLAVAAALPRRQALAAGAACGRSWVALGLPRLETARVNLRIAFPELATADRERILTRSLENLGRSLAEFARLPRETPEGLRERVSLTGLPHLESALAASPGRGAIILTAHFGSWELMAAAMVARGFPVTAVQRPREDAWLDALIARQRRAGGAEWLARGSAARGALRALAAGRLLTVLYDQNCPREEGVFAPFFGRPACSRSGPIRIALRCGAPVVPVFIHREGEPGAHQVRIRPAIPLVAEDAQPDALEENARRLNAALEAEIRAAPDHWLWGHRRWRTRPPGLASPYPSRRR